jgi:hypothetical protein
MNRCVLLITLDLACSSSSMQLHVSDSASPAVGATGGSVVVAMPGGGSSGNGTGGIGGALSDGDAWTSNGDGENGNVVLPLIDGGTDAAQSELGAPVAEIMTSESTNFAGFDTLVYGDGSAVQTMIPSRECRYSASDADLCQSSLIHYSPGAPIVMKFLADLQAVGKVSSIQTDWCAKSTSFGTYTTISANGNTSHDLQCMANPTPAQCALYADCVALTGSPPIYSCRAVPDGGV